MSNRTKRRLAVLAYALAWLLLTAYSSWLGAAMVGFCFGLCWSSYHAWIAARFPIPEGTTK